MSGKSTISIGFLIEDANGGFKKLSLDAESFKKLMQASVKEAEKLKSSVINFASLSTAFDSFNKSLSDLQNVCQDLTNAYSAQVQAETQLATVMRNTMDAREEDIQSIKDLCSAQQELGVIGDEVQLAGAQELATYLSKRQSLEQLIPVMNDMLAQQYGLNASQENASQIATMLGKVMDGQVGALSRYGYKFDEAQEKILKYGTESQRVAVLCEVVSDSVGGVNAELAKTDVGKQKQLENTLGDVKEQLGAIAQKASPYITYTTSVGIAITTTIKLVKGLILASRTILNLGLITKYVTPQLHLMGSAFKSLAVSMRTGVIAAQSLKVALRGLLIATGVGVAIWALCEAISYLSSSTDEAGAGIESLNESTDNVSSHYVMMASAIYTDIASLEALIKTKSDTTKAVQDLNNKYGEVFSTYKTAAEWKQALISNAENYCKALAMQSEMEKLAGQAYQARRKAEKSQAHYDEVIKASKSRIDLQVAGGMSRSDAENAAAGIIKLAVDSYNRQAEELEDDKHRVAEKRAELLAQIKDANNPIIDPLKTTDIIPENSIKDISNRISKLQTKIDIELDPDKRRELYQEIEKLEAHKIWMEVGYKYDKLSLQNLNNVIPSEHDAKPITLPAQLDIKIDMEKVGEQMNNAIPEPVQMVPLDQLINPGLESISQILGTLSELTDESAAAWLQWGANVLDACRQALPAIMAVTGAKAAESAVATPIIGWTMAGLAIASVIASFAQLPKFAKGGIISGPTIGLMGEYAGASNNPEVVAPLDKLRGMLQPVESFNGGLVRFKIEGRTLVGILEKETNARHRS